MSFMNLTGTRLGSAFSRWGMSWADVQINVRRDGMLQQGQALRVLNLDGLSPPCHSAHLAAASQMVGTPSTRDAHAKGSGVVEGSAKMYAGALPADWPMLLKRAHGSCVDHKDINISRELKCQMTAASGQDTPHKCLSWWHCAVSDPGQELLDHQASQKDERLRAAEPDSAWRLEWRALRAEQLMLQGECHGVTEARLVPGHPESVEWLHIEFNSHISTLAREHGFSQEHAIAYTLLTCGGASALARAARSAGALARSAKVATGDATVRSTADSNDTSEAGCSCGGDSSDGSASRPASGDEESSALGLSTLYPESRGMVGKIMMSRALKYRNYDDRKVVAPDIYRNLTGPLSLMQSDPEAWNKLCGTYCATGAAALGVSVTTSALIIGNENANAFHNHRGVHTLLSRCGVREWHPTESDVVRFVSEGSAAIRVSHASENDERGTKAEGTDAPETGSNRAGANASTFGRMKSTSVAANSEGLWPGPDCGETGGGNDGGSDHCDRRIQRSLIYMGGEGYHLPPGATVSATEIANVE